MPNNPPLAGNWRASEAPPFRKHHSPIALFTGMLLNARLSFSLTAREKRVAAITAFDREAGDFYFVDAPDAEEGVRKLLTIVEGMP